MIPALNESASIAAVVRAVLPFADVVVVNDGSTDDTAAQAKGAGAHVVTHAARRGYDGALSSGIQWASDSGYTYAVTLDADGQHRGELVAEFVRELDGGAVVVAGVRDRFQRFGEWLFAVVATALWGLHDPLCGMKGYALTAYRAAGAFDTYGSIGTELLLRVARSGALVKQIPVPTRDRAGAARFGSGLRPNYRLLRALLFGAVLAKPIPGIRR